MVDVEDTALARLIDGTLRINGWSDREVVRHAVQQGHRLTRSDVSLYRQQGMKTLVPGKVKGLAAALRLPAHRVAVCVLEDLGIVVPADVRTPEEAVEQDETLTADTRESVLLLLSRDRQKTKPPR